MNLLVSDIDLNINLGEDENSRYVNLSALKISNCQGCFSCWTKTPGKSVIRDDAVSVHPLIAKSRNLIYVTRTKFGSYDTPLKTLLERCLPVQQAFIRLYHGETHHVQRSVQMKNAVIIAYGCISQEEKDVFEKLVSRNSHNMMFENYRVIFTGEEELRHIVKEEVLQWKNY